MTNSTFSLFLAIIVSLAVQTTSSFAAPAHWLGKQRALVLLVEWKNERARHDAAEMTDVFFTKDKMSLHDFFAENSQGAFEMTGDVRDWRRSTLNWNPDGSCDLDPIVNEAWRLFGGDINIADYDSDGDGKIDNLFVIHSGRINSDRVGPDCTFTEYAKADHAVVFQQEGIGKIGDSIPIGFYLHEAGHAYFGLPDLYADHYRGHYGIGMWGIMGLGAWGVSNEIRTADMFRYPSHFEPASKVKIGWLKPRVIRSTTTGVKLRPIETTGDLVAVPVSGGSTYYLEYRSPNGFSKNHRGHGLLIWKNLAFVQADGRDDLNHGRNLGRRPVPPIDENFGDSSDPFPGSLNVRTFEDQRARLRFENISLHSPDGPSELGYIELDIVTQTGFVRVPYRQPVLPEYNPLYSADWLP